MGKQLKNKVLRTLKSNPLFQLLEAGDAASKTLAKNWECSHRTMVLARYESAWLQLRGCAPNHDLYAVQPRVGSSLPKEQQVANAMVKHLKSAKSTLDSTKMRFVTSNPHYGDLKDVLGKFVDALPEDDNSTTRDMPIEVNNGRDGDPDGDGEGEPIDIQGSEPGSSSRTSVNSYERYCFGYGAS